MSTLRLTTLSNQGGTASVPSDTVINGTAKAWVNFNGTGTVAIRGSFNVSSITDNGTGDYTLNFANALTDSSYAVSVGQVAATTANDGSIGNFGILTTGSMGTAATTKSTTALRILARYLYNGGTGVFDVTECNVSIFR